MAPSDPDTAIELDAVRLPPPTFESLRVEYESLYKTCAVTRPASVEPVLKKAEANRARYEAVAQRIGVPWHFVAAIHSLESSASFTKHLHNGDPLTGRTVHVPAGRPPTGDPPFTWETSADDALRMKALDTWKEWGVAGLLYQLERYNGFGYRRVATPIHSPYLWSFSNHYTKGKFVADGKYDPEAVSAQCGGATLFRAMESKGLIGPLA